MIPLVLDNNPLTEKTLQGVTVLEADKNVMERRRYPRYDFFSCKYSILNYMALIVYEKLLNADSCFS